MSAMSNLRRVGSTLVLAVGPVVLSVFINVLVMIHYTPIGTRSNYGAEGVAVSLLGTIASVFLIHMAAGSKIWVRLICWAGFLWAVFWLWETSVSLAIYEFSR